MLDVAVEGRTDTDQGEEEEGAHKAQGHEVAVGLWKVYKEKIEISREIFSSELNLLNIQYIHIQVYICIYIYNMQKRTKTRQERNE